MAGAGISDGFEEQIFQGWPHDLHSADDQSRAPKGVEVLVYVEGERTGRLFLTDEAWHDLRLVAPRTGRKWWRIDLYVSPTFVPMEVNPALQDPRRLGVRVGEPVQREIGR